VAERRRRGIWPSCIVFLPPWKGIVVAFAVSINLLDATNRVHTTVAGILAVVTDLYGDSSFAMVRPDSR
jgi:hypothetical protein